MEVSGFRLRKSLLIIAILLSVVSCQTVSLTSPATTPGNLLPTQTHVSVTNTPQTYIGLQYPPLPESLKMGGSQVISPSSSSCEWAVSIVEDDDKFMLWLDKLLYRDQNGKPHLKVSDTVVIPVLEEDQEIIVSGCFLNGTLNAEIITLVNIDTQNEYNRWLSNEYIVQTWRANQNTGKLENISTANIECNAGTFFKHALNI